MAYTYDTNGRRSRKRSPAQVAPPAHRARASGPTPPKAITDAANASASLGYNALDAVNQASDFNAVATSYSRDALGNATAESSADIGPRGTQYDGLGLPSQITDGLGRATTVTRDALGRPIGLSVRRWRVRCSTCRPTW
jgi:YD repeat-containing protein